DLDINSPNPYSEKAFEFSPLNRVLTQAAPGEDWALENGNTIKFNYQTNTFNENEQTNPDNDNVKLFSVHHPENNPEKTELFFDGYYQAKQLYKTITKDENWQPNPTPELIEKNHTTEEFKNKRGQVILKRTYDENEAFDTYYVYDIKGNLTYVIPPKASDNIGIEGSLGFRVASQTNYSWINLVNVDKTFANEYNKKLLDYNNDAILNADIENEYNGQGGFTVTTLEAEEHITLNISFSANKSFELKKGELVSLKDYGTYKDTELGNLKGTGYNYVFLIKDNAIIIEGDGKLPSINQSFNSSTKLDYSDNYPWTSIMDIDSKDASNYETQLKNYPNAEWLTTTIANPYNGQGGLNISIDENDVITVNINTSFSTPLSLKKGISIPLSSKRRMADRELGDLSGTGYNYQFSIIENALFVIGEGEVVGLSGIFISEPPSTSSEEINGLSYIYHYDYRNRLIEKKIPGKGWEYIVYNTLDKPILTQDANLRTQNSWLFTKYDAFGRVVYTGKHVFEPIDYGDSLEDNSGRKQLQDNVNAQGANNIETRFQNDFYEMIGTTLLHYSNKVIPKIDIEVYTINYYDTYSNDVTSIGSEFLNPGTVTINTQDYQTTTETKTLTTGARVRILGTDQWITSVTYYDEDAKPIYAASKNDYLGTVDIIKSEIDFTGKVLQTESTHIKDANAPIIINDAYTYDHAGRLLTQTQTITGNTPELIVNNHYDELGQLESKGVGGSLGSPLQLVDYTYNIRGWLKTINNGDTTENDLFGFQLNYNTGANPLYNGNISETHWQTANDNNPRSYDYTYDALNRLKTANYHGNYVLNGTANQIEDYSLNYINYDKNGNILGLERTGLIGSENRIDIIDDLVYGYEASS
ncbi:DUF6443 domain-containing protein, partial [Xanthomarina spongicola]